MNLGPTFLSFYNNWLSTRITDSVSSLMNWRHRFTFPDASLFCPSPLHLSLQAPNWGLCPAGCEIQSPVSLPFSVPSLALICPAHCPVPGRRGSGRRGVWGVGSSILGCCRAERRKLTYQCPWLPHLINIMSLRCPCKAAWLALSNAEGAGCGVTGCWEA